MVYAVFYLPMAAHRSLLADKYHFDDSKVLTPAFRSELMGLICNPSTDLFQSCGWATRSLSARDISSGQLHPSAAYNLNAQAQDATTSLIQGVLDKGVNIREVYVDTIGPPATYQKRLERLFPALNFTVAKKADSLYPCVSAASVCAKVTRDAALDVLWSAWSATSASNEETWGSGYPSDVRCSSWLKRNAHALFGWGNECRFSWGTAKDLLESKNSPCHVEWPESDTENSAFTLSSFFLGANEECQDELAGWYGSKIRADEVF
ncbi:hypothetical protein K431DRAFT_283348 [Polychaeton citri CBS 116435]|uniref:Ribonuclease n=1 Tax=Polychaeton citri CBS 116435 TaxID=1314669 RepID=A0A9P4QCH7_9PEZI|nr:hypothetical protein K431DRAFT_283348 [Polychaeton citri CBS 116435]